MTQLKVNSENLNIVKGLIMYADDDKRFLAELFNAIYTIATEKTTLENWQNEKELREILHNAKLKIKEMIENK